MAAWEGHDANALWNEIPMIDRVSKDYDPLQDLNPARLSSIHSLAYWQSIHNLDTLLLLHEQGNKTYIRGRCAHLGVTATCQEREVEELRDHTVVQVAFSFLGSAYILTEDGTLWSSGYANGLLGRPHSRVPPDRFGAVPIGQAVRRVAAGESHALAMTEDQVFAFGWNNFGQLGVPGCSTVQQPRAMYHGAGPAAPRQVACGYYHSVILTVGGKVLTCGFGGCTGQGHHDDVPEMSEVRDLRAKHVQQVGCTLWCTYALSDGELYGWGNNSGGALGVGHQSGGNGNILTPTLIDCGGRHITTFRCAGVSVIAVTDTGECLFWGRDRHGVVIMSPQLVTGHPLPGDVCSRAGHSGGLVFLDTKENHQRVFPVLHTLERRDDAADVRRLQDAITAASATGEIRFQRAEADIAKLQRLMEESIKRENETRVAADNRLQVAETEIDELKPLLDESIARENETRVAADNRLEVAETENAKLKRLVEESIARENAITAASATAEIRFQRAEADIAKLQRLMEESIKREKETRVAADNRLQVAETENTELKRLLEETIARENAVSEALRGAERGRVSLEDRMNELQQNISGLRTAQHRGNAASNKFDELQKKVLELQTANQASAERDMRRENLFSGTIRVVEEGRVEQGVEISELRRRMAAMQLAQDAGMGQATQQQNVHQQDCDAKIAELETENRELRLQKRELLAQFRSATVDYRELQMDYSSHLESCGIDPMRAGARSVRQGRRGREQRRGPANTSGAARQERH